MIKSDMKKHTLGWLERMNRGKKLDFTIAIQRKEVWDLEHKSNLIASALVNVPIESLLFEEEGDNSEGFLVLDGKQRGTSFLQYLRGDFKISETCKIKEVDGVNIIGKFFCDLPEEMQVTLKETELTISVLRPLTEEERETIFFMRNQAVALTKTEITRVLLGGRNMDIIQKLCEHSFLEKVNVSRNRYLHQQVMLELLLLETGKDYGFSGKEMPKFAEEMKIEGISEEIHQGLLDTLKYLDEAVTEKNRSLRKIHVPMIYAVAKEAMKEGATPQEFSEWIKKFFKDIKGDNNEYNDACNNGSAMKSNVQKRLNFIMNHYKNNSYVQCKCV